MKETQESLQLMEKRIAVIMRIGVGIAMTLMIIGLVMFLWQPITFTDTSVSAIWINMWQGNGVAWMMMGLFVLILTPVLRVISTIVYFMHAKDVTYTIITTIVLLILIIGMFYGAMH
ncbi:DUF1634 domain-containing protein [Weissella ceti]|uniref:DUF1634 domain-containing protein n=1 Tax=Weissella ceti TaxID=759620 RepID=A0ABT3E2K6_9LACO|nr:DUF1634 domain-containing protein [Weissella ceti]MCW0952658.1 DUF1634 domain-containing protein [Weissella ceti]QVK12363.1 DUF1634 domain-containing protein [Weissella ceti]